MKANEFDANDLIKALNICAADELVSLGLIFCWINEHGEQECENPYLVIRNTSFVIDQELYTSLPAQMTVLYLRKRLRGERLSRMMDEL